MGVDIGRETYRHKLESAGSLTANRQVTFPDVDMPFSAPATWTPSLTGLSLGNGTMVGRYMQLGKLVWASLRITFGSSSGWTGIFEFSPPVTAAGTAGYGGGVGFLLDNTPAARQMCTALFQTTTAIRLSVTSGNVGPVSNTVPWTWAQNDIIDFTILYEVP